ncbi:MAG: hypothetical protein AAF882_18720 [Pseudomonadota bacterium]
MDDGDVGHPSALARGDGRCLGTILGKRRAAPVFLGIKLGKSTGKLGTCLSR